MLLLRFLIAAPVKSRALVTPCFFQNLLSAGFPRRRRQRVDRRAIGNAKTRLQKTTLHKLQKPVRITFQNLQNPSLSLSLSCANIEKRRLLENLGQSDFDPTA